MLVVQDGSMCTPVVLAQCLNGTITAKCCDLMFSSDATPFERGELGT
jgi:hypothetical protein